MALYLFVKYVHVACVVLSLAGFAARGALMLRASPLLQTRFVRVAPHVVDTLLLASALWLAWMMHQAPFVHGWLTAKVLGLFEVSVLHNIVHGLFGLAGLALAKTVSGARTYLIGGGAIYILLALIQAIGAGDWVPLVGADLWLHLALGIGMIALGYGLTRDRVTPVTT